MKNKPFNLFVALANAAELTVDNLRELVRAVAQTDARFLKKPDGAAAVPSQIWVSDLIAPQATADKWQAIIWAADNKTYQVSFTLANGAVTLGDDAKEVVRVTSYQTLANSADVVDVLGLENTLSLDNDGWALLAPFGEHKKERTVRAADGSLRTEKYLQVLDAESVDIVIANERGTNLFQKIKRALVRRPIYRDHPDLKLYAPETVTLGNEKLVPLGVNDGCRKSERGLEFRPLLVPDGTVAVENDGCKYPSALFLLKKTGEVRDGWTVVRPFALASIGLTPFPNISGVDSLANASATKPAANQTDQNKDTIMKQLLLGWLAAQGIVLANDATEQAVWEKFLDHNKTQVANITTLGNSKTQLEALTGDKAKLAQGATLPANLVEAANEILTLGNARTELAAERKARCEAVIDLHIGAGRLAVAERDAEVGKLVALDNTKLATAIADLAKLPVKYPVGGGVSGGRKDEAGKLTIESAQSEVISLANTDERYRKLPTFAQAMEAVLKDRPDLAAALRAQPAAEKKEVATT